MESFGKPPANKHLSQREQQILSLVVEGLSNQQIADRLVISLGTTKWYIKQIYRKLKVSNRTQAIAQAHLWEQNQEDTDRSSSWTLPYQPTAFIGRSAELTLIEDLLANPHCRLLTLVGIGGIGKTRLALEVAERYRSAHPDAFPDGICFVPLAAVESLQFMVATLTSALQFPVFAPTDARTQFLRRLSHKQGLLILDSYEHLLDTVDFISEMLKYGQQLKILVTTRERLNLQEEWIVDVRGLRYPPVSEEAEPIHEYEAVQMVMERAAQVQPGFSLTADTQPAVVRLCRMLEGMPLAIELAMSWLRSLSLEQIGHKIQSEGQYLTTKLHNIPDRHRSLRIVFDQSWALLTETECQVMMRLSVFRGGFDLEAAGQVARSTLPVLTSLADKSLIRLSVSGRYDMHELLRQYADEQLEAAGEGEATRQVHCQYYADFLQQREADLKGRRLRAAVDEIDADFDNVQVACAWAIAHRDFDRINQVVESLYRYGIDFNRLPEIQVFWRQALAQFTPHAGENVHPVWGRLLVRSVYNLSLEPSSRLRGAVEQALDIARRRGDSVEIGFSLWALGVLSLTGNDVAQARERFDESLACYEQLTDRFYRAYYLAELFAWLGWYCKQLGQLDDSARYFQQGRELCREIGDKFHEALNLHRLAIIALEAGHIGAAEQFVRLSDSTFPIAPRESSRAMVYASWSGLISILRGDHEQIRSNGEALLKGLTDFEYWGTNRDALGLVGVAACLDEDYLEGKQLCEEATRLSHLALTYFAPAGEWGLALANCGLGDYDAAYQYVKVLLRLGADRRSLLTLVISLPPQAVILAHAGEPERAVELLGLAFGYLASMSGWMARWPLLTRLRANLEAELGPEVYAAAWEQGKALDLDTVVAELLN